MHFVYGFGTGFVTGMGLLFVYHKRVLKRATTELTTLKNGLVELKNKLHVAR